MHFFLLLDLKPAVIGKKDGECGYMHDSVLFFPQKVLPPELLAFHGVRTASTTSVTSGSLSSIC